MSITTRLRTICNRVPSMLGQITQVRESSYKSSLYLEDVGPVNTPYEISKDPIEWDYVKRVLPPVIVPEPLKRDSYPSGWKPQAEDLTGRAYFIKRTKNHMIPCYLKIRPHGPKKTTVLKFIQGDILLLEQELKNFLQPQNFQPLRTQVNEFAMFIRINGDHVNAIKYYLEQKGY